MPHLLFAQLDARDRALFRRWATFEHASRETRVLWTGLTHLGGAGCSIAAACIPLLTHGAARAVGRHALAALLVSHLIVQLVKRTVGRPRPSRASLCRALVDEPDRFSFPSGHSAAAMSVAVVYACAFPALAPVIVPLAVSVGMSRVFLGVHYPGDVFIGQVIAALTAAAIVLA